MLHINFISGTKKSMAAVLFVVTALANAGVASAEMETCLLVKQLEDPIENYKFRTRLNTAVQASTSQYGEYYADQPVTIVKEGESFEVDSFSFGCLSCHDGTTTPSHDIGFKNAGSSYSGSDRRSHPIGMHYGSASYGNNQLQRLENLNPNMILIDGRVGCLTCHNPLNPKIPHLSVSMDRSTLCMTCHLK